MSETNKTIEYAKFMQNKKCEFFPCHNVSWEDQFNCLFCFCPLYHLKNCGGNYTFTESGIKNCENCTLPHKKENYDYVINTLKETGSKLQ